MSVLILGATSRLAAQLAQRYAEAGHSVCVAGRNLEEAERVAADLRVRHEVEAEARAFDAIDYASHPALIEAVDASLGPVEIGVIAFGDMGVQGRSELDFDAARRVIDVNYTGAVSVAESLARAMAGRGRGSIVGLASVAGDRGRKSNYFYGSAKGAFALYLQGLRNRMHGLGVHVMTVKLGFVDTRMTYGLETGIPIASPERASAAIYAGQKRQVDSVYYPSFWRGIMGVVRAIPETAFKRMSL